MMRLAYVQVIPVSSRVGFQTAQKPHFQSGFTSLDSLYDNSEQIYVITSNSYPLLFKPLICEGQPIKGKLVQREGRLNRRRTNCFSQQITKTQYRQMRLITSHKSHKATVIEFKSVDLEIGIIFMSSFLSQSASSKSLFFL